MTYQDTSRAAFAVAARGDNERKVLILLKCSPDGMTCDEFMNRTGMPHQSASPAFTALERRGLITRTSTRRPTRTGAKAAVYVISQPDSLFAPPPRKSASESLRTLVVAALRARHTGSWDDFDIAMRWLTESERKKLNTNGGIS